MRLRRLCKEFSLLPGGLRQQAVPREWDGLFFRLQAFGFRRRGRSIVKMRKGAQPHLASRLSQTIHCRDVALLRLQRLRSNVSTEDSLLGTFYRVHHYN